MALRTSVNHLALTKPNPAPWLAPMWSCHNYWLCDTVPKGTVQQQQRDRPSIRSEAVKTKGRGADFTEVRQYQAGDDVRSIDWRVTARKNTPHTRYFAKSARRPVLLFIDQSQPMFFGSQLRLKSVAAADIAARILANANRWRSSGCCYCRQSRPASVSTPSQQPLSGALAKTISRFQPDTES
ncbi:MAG: hypothetical protein CM15mP120_03340 [Pseudomonadota bacterium]|nr:MAG: hypothetical protein CM15mP120_03340 [Pseudomonadota bacterium]